MTPATFRLSSSFRDQSGFLFTENGTLFRSVSRRYRQHYDHLLQSGLYDKLVENKLIIPHEEVDPGTIKHFPGSRADIYKIIQPERVPFISYPYEWCFSQLKDAALTTLKIQKQALDYGMVLKDANAYNVQFHKGLPLLIDTLSFEIYQENQPWVAYRQFCQHFLAPLALMASRDIRLGQFMRIYIDGLPLDLASGLLPLASLLKPALLTHIHLHAKAQKRYGQSDGKNTGWHPTNSSPPAGGDKMEGANGEHSPLSHQALSGRKVSKTALLGIVDSLETSVNKLKWQPTGTEWADYYEDTNYSPAAMNHKKQLVDAYLKEIKPRTVWDLGANTGVFSRIAAANDAETIAFDVDAAAVEKNYLMAKEGNVSRGEDLSVSQSRGKDSKSVSLSTEKSVILPLCLDLTNPSPAIGWANAERLSLIERGPADTVLALALIHHLAISNNVSFRHVAFFLSQLCRFLIIEFVPKNDSQVQRLLRIREDVFPDYGQDHFEAFFGENFSLIKHEKITDTERTLYLMRSRNTRN